MKKLYQFSQKFGRLVMLSVAGLVTLFAILIYNSNYSKYYDEEYKAAYDKTSQAVDMTDSKSIETVKILANKDASNVATDLSAGEASVVGFVFVEILAILAGLLCLILPVVVRNGDFAFLKKFGIGLGVLLLIFAVCYGMASGEAIGTASASTVKWSDMLIKSAIVLFVLAVIGIVVAEVRTMIKS